MASRLSRFKREFLLLTISAAAATVWDIQSTVHAQNDPEAAEVNWWIYGERPSRARMYAVNIPVTLAFVHFAYRLSNRYAKGRGRWLWRVPLLTLCAGHAVAALANRRNFP